MTSIKDNKIFDKTSFLEGSNSAFIEDLYLIYVNNPEDIPVSWKEFFDGLNEDKKIVKTEITGPSWAPKRYNISKIDQHDKKIKLSFEDNKTTECDFLIISNASLTLISFSLK